MFVSDRRFGFVHAQAREGVGESQFRRGTYTVVLYIHMYFVCAGVGGMAQAAPSGTAVVGAGEDPDTLY
jgi:hypothetical protein